MFHGGFQRLIGRKALCQWHSDARRVGGEKARGTFFEVFRSSRKAACAGSQGDASRGLLTTDMYV